MTPAASPVIVGIDFLTLMNELFENVGADGTQSLWNFDGGLGTLV